MKVKVPFHLNGEENVIIFPILMIGNYSARFLIRLSHGGQRIGSNRNHRIFIATKRESHIISTFALVIIRGVHSHVGVCYACAVYTRRAMSVTKS